MMGRDYSRLWTAQQLRKEGWIPQEEAELLLGLPKGEMISWDYIDSEQTGADGQTWVQLLPQHRPHASRTTQQSPESQRPTDPTTPLPWIPQSEAKSLLGIHQSTLYRYMKDGIVRYTNTVPRLVNREDV